MTTLENNVKNIDMIRQRFNSTAYDLLEQIGSGGFGRVYKAQHVNTGQIVAIKFLSISDDFDEIKKQRYIERFERETLLGSKLQHPNIVRLLDKGHCDELFYAVFEYVEGTTLKERLAESGPLTPNETYDVMSQVLDALAHAHHNGVLHRDIKPSNIMLTNTGVKTHAKVLDFGIGTLVNDARQHDYKSLTLTQETLGTPSYSAPEQLRGEPPTLKTDLYVWGLVFIECLTGQPAMSGSSLASIFHKQLSQSHVPLPIAIISHPIAAILRRVLEKNALARNVEAHELYNELTQINFANLVGNLAQQQNTNEQVVDCNDTVINENHSFHTSLTERKQITTLSICLQVHSVEGVHCDAEVVDALHRDQKNQCSDIALRYGAFNAGSLGDSLLFYFGYPNVSDNDARLCARTALDIVSSLKKRNALLKVSQGIEFDVRIGMHTGLVTCYLDNIPEGDSTNTAMQLSRMAENEQILCSDTSQKILNGYIEFEPVQQYALGIAQQPSMVSSLVAERQVEAFGFLRGAQQNHAFIGRLQEFNQVIDNANLATDDKSKLTHVYGEAGIGKSRLIFEIRNKLQGRSHYIAQCLPEYQNNALFPILNVLKNQYHLDKTDPSANLQTLTTAIKTLNFDELAPLDIDDITQQATLIMSSWLSLPADFDVTSSNLAPETQNKILFATLAGLLTQKSHNLFIFEDLHWADPTSLEFIHYLVNSSKLAESVCISTSRQVVPEQLQSCAEVVLLERLNAQDTGLFIAELFDKELVAQDLLDMIIERTDGIPLFIEELVDMLKTKALVHKLNGFVSFVDPNVVEQVPMTLRDSLQQKLDLLVSAKDTAQLAATIGREFSYELLVAISNKNESQLQQDLNELVDSEIVYLQRKVTSDSYIFKHALVRDAAYDSLSVNNKVQLHLNIAKTLEQNSGEYLPLVAHHYQQAHEYDIALQLWIQIADSHKKSALHIEAVSNYEKGLLLIEKINDEAKTFAAEITIRSALAISFSATIGYANDSINSHLEKAIRLYEKYTGDISDSSTQQLYFIQWSKAMFEVVKASHSEGLDSIKELYKIALNPLSPTLFIASAMLKGAIEFAQGRFSVSKLTHEEALPYYDYNEHHDILANFSFDAGITLDLMQSLNLWFLGDNEQSQYHVNKAIEYCEITNLVTDKTHTYNYCAFLYVFKKDLDNTYYFADKCLKLAEIHQHEVWIAHAKVLLGWVQCHRGNFTAGLTMIDDGYEAYTATGGIGHTSFMSTLKAESLLLKGEYSSANIAIDEAIRLANKYDDGFYLAETFRVKHLILLAQDKSSDYLNKSYEYAKSQNAIGYINEILKK